MSENHRSFEHGIALIIISKREEHVEETLTRVKKDGL